MRSALPAANPATIALLLPSQRGLEFLRLLKMTHNRRAHVRQQRRSILRSEPAESVSRPTTAAFSRETRPRDLRNPNQTISPAARSRLSRCFSSSAFTFREPVALRSYILLN